MSDSVFCFPGTNAKPRFANLAGLKNGRLLEAAEANGFPSTRAAKVTVRPSGSKHSSRTMRPGCEDFSCAWRFRFSLEKQVCGYAEQYR